MAGLEPLLCGQEDLAPPQLLFLSPAGRGRSPSEAWEGEGGPVSNDGVVFRLQSCVNGFQHPFEIGKNVSVPKSQYEEANSLERTGPLFIGFQLFRMLAAVKLYNYLCIEAGKVSHIAKQRHLAAEFSARHLAVAQS